MLALAFELVVHEEAVRVSIELDRAYRSDRAGEAPVTRVCSLEAARLPGTQLRQRILGHRPQQARVEAVLLRAVEPRRVVECCRAETVSLLGRGGVDVGAGVAHEPHPCERRLEREAIVVPVPAAAG